MKKISLTAIVVITTAIAVAQSKVGIGTTTPNSLLHLRSGNAGVAPYFLANLTIESNDRTYLQLLTPANKESGLMFGNPNAATQGGIYYNTVSTPEGLEFRTNGNVARMAIDNTGKLDLNGGLRIRGNNPKAGALLIADGNTGNTVWMQPSAFRVEGLYELADVNTTPFSNFIKLEFNNIPTYNIGLTYAAGVSEYTAPVKGIYHINLKTTAYLQEEKNTSATYIYTKSLISLKRKRAGSTINLAESTHSTGIDGDNSLILTTFNLVVSEDFLLEAGDVIWAELYQPRNGFVAGAATKTSFSGHLVTRVF